MTNIKKKTKGGVKAKKLQVNKETLKDLNSGKGANRIKGGGVAYTNWQSCSCAGC